VTAVEGVEKLVTVAMHHRPVNAMSLSFLEELSGTITRLEVVVHAWHPHTASPLTAKPSLPAF
jgi:hypothetical protein